ncbi:uncharacterized protein LOC116262894 [Nymphaea colorata]|uniref:uncharacterized protein LOC116262894 n=1 Tax=Nymphaea colorata TaxID=210225 RepID=UPI00129DF267|nr:uncharacterized protein LOC116262894 [Nymphaea colorata]XP_049936171.1 uncharacterized protein LOC116262894 [Nymphaea colorata]
MGNHKSLQSRPSLPRGQPQGYATNRRLPPQEHPTGVYVHTDNQKDTHRHGGNHKSLYEGNHWNPQSVHTSNRGVHSLMSNHEAPPQGNKKNPQFRLDVHTGNQKGTQASNVHHHESDQESLHGGNHWDPQSSLYVHIGSRGAHLYRSDNHEAPPQGRKKDPQFRLDVHTGNQKGTQANNVHHHESDQESLHGGIHWNPQSSLYVHIGNRGAHLYRIDNHEAPPQGNNKDPRYRTRNHKERVAQQLAALALWGNHEDRQPGGLTSRSPRIFT